MTHEEINAMAKEAGAAKFYPDHQKASKDTYLVTTGFVERFAALVAAKAAADERAACAQVCDRFDTGRWLASDYKAQEMAAFIRARSHQ